MTEHYPEYQNQESLDAQKKISFFETAKGSVYKLDDEGRTSRYKTLEKKEYESSGITVYVPHKFSEYMSALTYNDEDAPVKLVESRADGMYRIKDTSEVQNKSNVRLVFVDKINAGQFIKLKTLEGLKPAIFEISFEPQLGFHPFEIGYDEQFKKTYHFGNEITKINQT